MAGGYVWSRRVGARVRTLRGLVNDTQKALNDVVDILCIDRDVHAAIQEIGNQSLRNTALVIFGTTTEAKIRLLHGLLGCQILPDTMPRACRWIRVQYGSSTQVHLSLGNSEFELVEDLECNKGPWDILPVEDLIRQDSTDLTTILELEVNNQFLKGLSIVIPPDITEPGSSNYLQLKTIHSELYNKRSSILRNFNCVYLYAVDRVGKNIFSNNIFCSNMATSRSEEEFWSTFSLYNIGGVREEEELEDGEDKVEGGRVGWSEGSGEPAVFTPENCLDLHQMKELCPSSQPLFVLLGGPAGLAAAGPPDGTCPAPAPAAPAAPAPAAPAPAGWPDELPEADRHLHVRLLRNSSESPEPRKITCGGDTRAMREDQAAFMNDLLDQWELMTNPPQKHHVKPQWCILEDAELRTVDSKVTPTSYTPHVPSAGDTCGKGKHEHKVLRTRHSLLNVVVKFATDTSQTYLLEYCTRLSEIHVKLLQQFILASFDMARELQVVPKKIQYVAEQEHHLFEAINAKFTEGEKKQELVQIMHEVLQEMKTEINNMDWSVDDLPWHLDRRFATSSSTLSGSCRSSPYLSLSLSWGPQEAAADTLAFDDYDIIGGAGDCFNDRLKPEEPVISSPDDIRVENESESFSTWSTSASCSSGAVSVKHATDDVQQTVLSRLSRKISLKLVKFFDCLKESYFGTLQRCLESLEGPCRAELGGRPASEAMRQLLSAGRAVALQPSAAGSLLRALLDHVRRLLHRLRLAAEEEAACCVLSPVWRRRVALRTLRSLSGPRLARTISAQILERLREAHEKYQSALATLESVLASRLHHTEDIKLAIRKKYAPSFARLCLESTSMCDLLMYGTPELGREIGRGQYGVVYSVRGAWGGRSPVAVKSVLPADERHYRDLAMEFFYTRSIPAHPRVVRLVGSVVQRAGGAGGGGPGGGPGGGAGGGRAVLLVSERRARDLHAAVRAGLPAHHRLRIAIDIVEVDGYHRMSEFALMVTKTFACEKESFMTMSIINTTMDWYSGIRYLHSLGLVHRDIKLKNVLLDAQNRAALSDLGFCTTGALMSGSIVGTPIHMAPELLDGEYSSMVDVYAFGILFWYLCAGDVKLPEAFETFHNKEQLWSKVKKGLRPERLAHFSDESWALMEACWAGPPARRALLGDVQPRLQRLLDALHSAPSGPGRTPGCDLHCPLVGRLGRSLNNLNDEETSCECKSNV